MNYKSIIQKRLNPLSCMGLAVMILLALQIKFYPKIQTLNQALIQREWISAGLIVAILLLFLLCIPLMLLKVRNLEGVTSRLELYLLKTSVYLGSFACLIQAVRSTGFVVIPGWLNAVFASSMTAWLVLIAASYVLNPLKRLVFRLLD